MSNQAYFKKNKFQNFGIILTCYKGDYFLTKGLLASIHYFLPSIPICIIQDGDFSLDKEREVYNISHIVKKEDVKNDFLREKCFGSRCSNLIAFFEAPFEKFLYLDSDLVLWGDILKNLDIDEIEFIHNEPHEKYTERIVKEQYFDFDELFAFTEYFNWKECHLFNSGVFIAKKNIFKFAELKELIEIWHMHRNMMPTDPQSILNIIVFRNKLKANLKVSEKHLQTVVPVIENKDLVTNFKIIDNQPHIIRNTIIHWAGRKPNLLNSKKVFNAPMIYFRKQNLINVDSFWKHCPTIYFYFEEYCALIYRYQLKLTLSRIKHKWGKYITSLKVINY